MTIEEKARAVGDNPVELLRRLRSAEQMLMPRHREKFRQPRFSFKEKRLYGQRGYYLQWTVRRHPDEPVSYYNQQTSVGTVRLRQLPPEERTNDD
jgi:hypothetical protein